MMGGPAGPLGPLAGPGRGMPGRGPPRGPPPRGPPRGQAPMGLPPIGGGAQPAKARFGRLTVQVVGGTSLRSPGLAGSPDPFVKVQIGSTEHQTKVHAGGGKNPVFGDTFLFEISSEQEIEIRAFDKQPNGSDKLIGTARQNFMGWLAKGAFEGDIDIRDEQGQPAGSITVKTRFERPQAAQNAPPPPGAAPPQGMPGPAGAAGMTSEAPRDPNGKFTNQYVLSMYRGGGMCC